MNKHPRGLAKSRLLALGTLLLIPLAGVSQIFRGGLSGNIVDSSGAVVSGAKVVAVDVATGIQHETVTSSAGDFSFGDLPLGTYTVTAEEAGFETVKVEKISIQAGQVYTLPLKLGVAQNAQTIQVNAASISLDTTSTTNTTVIPDETVQDTPMNGRDFTQLIQVAPGFAGYSAGGFGSVNGTRANQVNWQIDGVDNNDIWHNIPAVNQGGVEGIAGITLPLDSVEQFSEQTQGDAENGRNPGGSVNVVTKSGTNTLHGSAYYYNRNEFFAKNSPFATPDADGNILKNKLRNQQYGASVGGPIVRDKLFYFANYEKQQFIIESPASATEPSLAYQSEAAAVLAQYGVPVSPVATNLLSTLWPAYALTGAASGSNYSNASPISGYSYNAVAKLDYTLNEKNSISGRAFGGQGNQIAPVGTQLPYYFEEGPIHVYNYSASWNSTWTPTLSNQLLVGVNYFNQVFYDQNHSFDVAALGLNTGVSAALSGAPGIDISGFDNLQNATPPSGRNDITGQLADVATWVHGKHAYRFGGEFRQAQLDEFYHRKERGSFLFTGTVGPWATDQATASDPNIYSLADFLAGYAENATIVRGDTERQVFVNTYNLFMQDAWQLSPKLNINYGIRYDYMGPLHDGYQDLSVFRPGIANGATPGIAFQGNQISSLFPPAHDNVSPRFGFAYQPGMHGSDALVLRGSFGVYFDEPNLNPFLDNRPPNGGASGVESNPAGPNPVGTITLTNVALQPNVLIWPTSATFSPTNSYNLFSISPNFRSSYNYNFAFSAEQRLSSSVIFTIGYVGSEGRKLLLNHDINQAPVGTTTNQNLTTLQQNALRPYEQSGALGGGFANYGVIDEVSSIGTSNYSSLQTTLRTANFHGLTSQFGYTWSHGLDEMTSYRNANPQNSYDLKGDYGNMDFDTRNNFTAYLNYNVPGSSHGPHWLSNGWQLNSLMTFHGGQPYTVYTGTDSSGTGESEDRANQIGSPTAGVQRTLVKGSGFEDWITPNAFATPVNAFGTMARNALFAPGFGDVDLSVFKNGHIGERFTVQGRVEMFNLFNRTNLAPPNNTLGSGFGQVTTTIGNYNGAPGIGPGEPFNTQLALKILF